MSDDPIPIPDALLPVVDLYVAHVWTCEECGSDNFERRRVEEGWKVRQRLAEDEDMPEGIRELLSGNYEWISMAPPYVTCQQCGARFRAHESEWGYGKVGPQPLGRSDE